MKGRLKVGDIFKISNGFGSNLFEVILEEDLLKGIKRPPHKTMKITSYKNNVPVTIEVISCKAKLILLYNGYNALYNYKKDYETTNNS